MVLIVGQIQATEKEASKHELVFLHCQITETDAFLEAHHFKTPGSAVIYSIGFGSAHFPRLQPTI